MKILFCSLLAISKARLCFPNQSLNLLLDSEYKTFEEMVKVKLSKLQVQDLLDNFLGITRFKANWLCQLNMLGVFLG